MHPQTIVAALALCAAAATAQGVKTENKNVTLIQAQVAADGRTQIARELLEDCILSLPDEAALDPVVATQTAFLHEINGAAGKNAHSRLYSASLEVNYLLYQKELIIVSVNSVQGVKPEMKEVEKRIQQMKLFVSDSSNGDAYAGKSNRRYYFSSAEGAKADVLRQAKAWLRQKKGAACLTGK